MTLTTTAIEMGKFYENIAGILEKIFGDEKTIFNLLYFTADYYKDLEDDCVATIGLYNLYENKDQWTGYAHNFVVNRIPVSAIQGYFDSKEIYI